MEQPNAPDAANAANAADNAASSSRFFKLPDFWTGSAAAWFGVAEAQFNIRGVTSQRDKFALVSAVLPEASGRRVTHLLAAPGDNCYDDLRAALLAAHQLTAYQKAEKLLSSEPLGDRRPSDLLAELLELVKPGDEKTNLFSLIFLRRLPAAVRLQLTEDDHEDVRALAQKADRCAASLHKHQGQLISAVGATEDADPVELELAPVAAVRAARGGGNQRRNNRGGRGGRPAGQNQQSGQQAQQDPPNTPARVAQQASGICFKHFRYGDQAYGCVKPCSWQGN